MHAWHRAGNGCLSQEEHLVRRFVAFYGATAPSLLFAQSILLTLPFQVGFDDFKCALRSIFFWQLDHEEVLCIGLLFLGGWSK